MKQVIVWELNVGREMQWTLRSKILVGCGSHRWFQSYSSTIVPLYIHTLYCALCTVKTVPIFPCLLPSRYVCPMGSMGRKPEEKEEASVFLLSSLYLVASRSKSSPGSSLLLGCLSLYLLDLLPQFQGSQPDIADFWAPIISHSNFLLLLISRLPHCLCFAFWHSHHYVNNALY